MPRPAPVMGPLYFWNHSATVGGTARRSPKERGVVLQGSNTGLFSGTSGGIDGRDLADLPGAVFQHHRQRQHLARAAAALVAFAAAAEGNEDVGRAGAPAHGGGVHAAQPGRAV